jgi:hypothetical protein
MGTGFTIDTPLKVARYGISSVVSLVDDVLIEQMRKHHCAASGQPYEEITNKDDDPRARRITAYLDLLGMLIARQVKQLQASPFEPGSEITRYFEMLPDRPLREKYNGMLKCADPASVEQMQAELRREAVPGDIDVNIMTKLDAAAYRGGQKRPPEYSHAMAALRGFAKSSLQSSIVFSAGLNPSLYGYSGQFDDFYPDANGHLKKRIVLKVSDFRSALIQGKFFAKRGLWVSEYRIESGLNCGGHTFATKGILLGPILEEFKRNKDQFADVLLPSLNKSLEKQERPGFHAPPQARVTVQGGIGEAWEDEFLLRFYRVDGTGWATPFMLVPEVVSVDDEHLKRLCEAGDNEVFLGDSSPFGVPLWNLNTSFSEEARRRRIQEGRPGTGCPKGFLVTTDEFSKAPQCLASRSYQKKKLEHVFSNGLNEAQRKFMEIKVLAKSCICHDLAGGATLKNGIDPDATPAIVCGPNIVNFSKVATLEEMVGHIYGRISLLTRSNRPQMFLREMAIYIERLRKEAEEYSLGLSEKTPKYFAEFKENLLAGADYYKELAEHFVDEKKKQFLEELEALRQAIEPLSVAAEV